MLMSARWREVAVAIVFFHCVLPFCCKTLLVIHDTISVLPAEPAALLPRMLLLCLLLLLPAAVDETMITF